MNGWQRFFLLIVFCVSILICWPQYDRTGLNFLGLAFILWTCVIMMFSIFVNIFALYKLENLHRLLSLILIVVMLGSLLAYFPLRNNQTPLSRMQQNLWPTLQDMKQGMQQLTFNFDFVRRNVHRDDNYINQTWREGKEKTKEAAQEVKQAVKDTKEQIDIWAEEIDGENAR